MTRLFFLAATVFASHGFCGEKTFKIYLPVSAKNKISVESVYSDCTLGALAVHVKMSNGRNEIFCLNSRNIHRALGVPATRATLIQAALNKDTSAEMKNTVRELANGYETSPFLKATPYVTYFSPRFVSNEQEHKTEFGNANYLPIRVEAIAATASLSPKELELFRQLSAAKVQMIVTTGTNPSPGVTVTVLGFVNTVSFGVSYEAHLRNAKIAPSGKRPDWLLVEASEIYVPPRRISGSQESVEADIRHIEKAFGEQSIEELRKLSTTISGPVRVSVTYEAFPANPIIPKNEPQKTEESLPGNQI